MNKKIINKIQLILGLVVLIIGIGGLVFANNMYQKIQGPESLSSTDYFVSATGITINIALTSGLAIIISFLFITQGLINLSTGNKNV